MSKSTLLASRRPRKAKSVPNRAAAPAATIYDVHPGIVMVQKWIDDLPAKTGRSLDGWLTHIRKSGPGDEKASRQWLIAEHRLGPNTAWWLAEKAFHPAKLAEETPAGYLK